MVIKADKEGKAFLVQVCDLARKVCDLNSVGNILTVLNLIEEIPDEIRGKEQDNTGKQPVAVRGSDNNEEKDDTSNGDGAKPEDKRDD